MKNQTNRSVAITRRTAAVQILVSLLLITVATGNVWGVGLTYVDADDLLPNISPLSAVNSGGFVNDDNLWGYRSGFGANGAIFESGIAEDSPQLTQTISGLSSGSSYDVYGVFWSNPNENWMLQVGVSPENLTLYTFRIDATSAAAGAVAGDFAAAAIWDSPPLDAGGNPIFSQDDNLVMMLGFGGTAVADASGQIDVFIDDRNWGGARRTWFDGVAYVAADTPVLLTASVDRDTGELVVTNPTPTDFQITSYEVSSAAGSLDATQWSPISGVRDGNGDSSFDSDVWNITAPADPASTPYAAQLAEAEDASAAVVGGTLAADGGSLNLGNVWQKTPFEDVVVSLTLENDTTLTLAPTYAGTAALSGDLNGNGDLDPGDHQILMANMYTNVEELTAAERYARGDVTGNGAIDFQDFITFRNAFDATNGAGAFAQMVASVPEPSSCVLALVVLALLGWRHRGGRRTMPVRRIALMVLAITLMGAAGSRLDAAPVTGWEIDPLLPAEAVLSDADTSSPILGDGTPNNANAVAIYAPTPLATIEHGEQIVLSGTVEFLGIDPSASDFRWALLKDDGVPPDTGGWLGYFAINANGTAAGSILSRDPAGTDFDTVTFASLVAGRGTTLGTVSERENRLLLEGLYDFTMTVGRFGDTAEIRATLVAPDGSYHFATDSFPESDPTRVIFDFDRVGFLSGGALDADQIRFSDIDVSVSNIEAPTLRVESTGQVQIVNGSSQPLDFIFYEITSPAGALNVAGWTGLGTGWEKAGGSASDVLGEGNLTSAATLAIDETLGIGSAFTPGGAQDLVFHYATTDGTLLRGFVEYVQSPGLDGDFNMDGKVDAADYTVWRDTLGDAPSYELWKANFGNTAGSGASTSAVPEPGTWILLSTALATLACGALRRRQQA